MSTYITILAVPYPQNVYIIKARLESEGIECRLKDELTVQTDPLIQNAIGGIKLQVREEDVEAAERILDEEGYKRYIEDDSNPYQPIQTFADKIPVFKGMRFEIKLGLLVVIIIVVVYLIGYFISSKPHSP